MIKPLILRAGLALIFCAALAGCTGSQHQTNTGVNSSSSATLSIGGIVSKTGPAAAYGQDTEEGALLAVDEINKKGNALQVNYIAADDKTDKNEAVKVARTLIEVNKVDAIIGPIISPSALTVGKLCEERQVPMVTTSATQDEVTVSPEYDRQYVSRVCFNDSYQGKILAKYAASTLHKKTAAIVYDNTLSYSIGLTKTFREEFTRLGGHVAQEESYSVKDTDYSSLIDKVATFKVDVLFIPGWDENVGPMLKQAAGRWNKFTLLGGDGWTSKKFLELAAGNIHDAYAIMHYAPDDKSPEVQNFQKAYHQKYNRDASQYAALGYDAVMLVWQAAQKSKTLDGPALKDAINHSKGIKGVTGTITFDTHRNPQKGAVIVKVLPDKFLFAQRVQP